LDIFELGAALECAPTNSLEVFVADDTLERGACSKRHLPNDCELIGKGNALEGTLLECTSVESFEFLVEDDGLEGGALEERSIFDDFELVGESDTPEGGALAECSPS